jgi:hypothetical protein
MKKYTSTLTNGPITKSSNIEIQHATSSPQTHSLINIYVSVQQVLFLYIINLRISTKPLTFGGLYLVNFLIIRLPNYEKNR